MTGNIQSKTGETRPAEDPSLVPSSVPDDLVVATAHLPLVEPALVSLGVWDARRDPRRFEQNDRLGLARLTLHHVEYGEAKVRAQYPDRLGRLKAELERENAYSPIDAIVLKLRLDFGDGYWTPELGKNRNVSGVVVAFGGTKGMAVGNPQLASPEDAPEPPAEPLGSGVRIGILDSPLYPHSRFVGHLPADAILRALLDMQAHDSKEPLWRPWQGHATFVTDLILDHAPGATIDLQAVLGGDLGTATAWATAKKIVAFADSGIDILNLSLGCRTVDGRPPLVLRRAIERLGPGVLVVAAGGNHGDGPHPEAAIWPAALPDVVAVGAVEPEATFSPRLPWLTCTAQALDLVGAFLREDVEFPSGSDKDGGVQPTHFQGYARWNGTSFAAATVSGAVAAAMTGGRNAREAFEALCAEPDGIVHRYVHQPRVPAGRSPDDRRPTGGG